VASFRLRFKVEKISFLCPNLCPKKARLYLFSPTFFFAVVFDSLFFFSYTPNIPIPPMFLKIMGMHPVGQVPLQIPQHCPFERRCPPPFVPDPLLPDHKLFFSPSDGSFYAKFVNGFPLFSRCLSSTRLFCSQCPTPTTPSPFPSRRIPDPTNVPKRFHFICRELSSSSFSVKAGTYLTPLLFLSFTP